MPRLCLAALALAACVPLSADSVYHVLKKGETLFSLSREYNVPVNAIESANQISDPSGLQVGRRILIPSLHRVQSGETLYGIARQYGISIEALRSANRIGPGSILRVGQLLFIPGGSGGGAAGTDRPEAGAGPQAPVVASAQSGAFSPAGQSAPPSSAPAATAPAATANPAISVPRGRDPPAVGISSRAVDMNVSWPCSGQANYLDGRLLGVMFRSRRGEVEKAVASGNVVSAGPYRGFGRVVFVEGRGGYIYVYGGNESLAVHVGDKVLSGQELGRVGVDAKEGRPTPIAYFFVFKNGKAVDPAAAPRD